MSKVWTREDLAKGWCQVSDVGQLVSDHELWDWPDVDAGTVPGYLVHTPKPPSACTTPAPPPPPKATVSIDDLVEGSITFETQDEFNKWAKSNPGVYFPMLAKHNLARDLKEKPTKLPKLEELSLQDLQAYSSADIKRMLLNSVGITTKDQAQDALG